MYKVEGRWKHQDKIKIEWNLGKRCNYDCSYCPKEIHDNYSPHTDYFILQNAVDKLCKIGKPLRISFTGGEPCVHPDFERLINYINKQPNVEFISVTTNGTRKPTWYSNLPIDQFVFSLHFEYDWENVLYTIKNVSRTFEKDILVNVMAHQDKMDSVKQAADLLKHFQIKHNIRRVRWTEGDHDLFDDMKYDQKDLDWILQYTSTVQPNCIIDDDKQYHANDIIKLHLNQYKGWSCNAGLESLMINYDGDVHRATCRVGGSLGNVYGDTFVAPTEPIICTRNYCTCAADIPLTKSSVVIQETQN